MQDSELGRAEEKLREIERLLNEQQREVERQRQACEQCRAELGTVQGREQDAAAVESDARRDVHLAADRVVESEQQAAQRQERERLSQQALREAGQETARVKAQRDVDEREVAAAKEREQQRKQEEAQALATVDAQERTVAAAEQESADFAARRRAVDDEEMPLLEQEVRLREQRESLETKEMKLRSDFESFAGRGCQARPESPAVSRHGSYAPADRTRESYREPTGGAPTAAAAQPSHRPAYLPVGGQLSYGGYDQCAGGSPAPCASRGTGASAYASAISRSKYDAAAPSPLPVAPYDAGGQSYHPAGAGTVGSKASVYDTQRYESQYGTSGALTRYDEPRYDDPRIC